jgi:hypothetical protein
MRRVIVSPPRIFLITSAALDPEEHTSNVGLILGRP